MLVKRVRELNDSLCRCGGLMGPVRNRRGSGVTVLADRLGRVRSESEMNFREIGPGRFFPPILPNGRFFALAIGGLRIQEILQVTDVGLECGGVSFGWGDICGYAIQGNEACLLSKKYASGGLRFTLGNCYFVGSAQPPERHVNGYPVEHCLMNRITFEQQRLQVLVCG